MESAKRKEIGNRILREVLGEPDKRTVVKSIYEATMYMKDGDKMVVMSRPVECYEPRIFTFTRNTDENENVFLEVEGCEIARKWAEMYDTFGDEDIEILTAVIL